MNLARIAARIAGVDEVSSEEHTSYSQSVYDAITEDQLRKMKIDPGSKPRVEGNNSAVFDNARGNIVVFSDSEKLFEVAEKAQGIGSDVLPEIYNVQKFKGDPDPLYAVEMQKLKILDGGELEAWDKWEDSIFISGFDEHDREEVMDKAETDEQQLVEAMIDLNQRSSDIKIYQTDMKNENVAWDKDGKLRFIDLELIDLEDVELIPIPKAASIVGIMRLCCSIQ